MRIPLAPCALACALLACRPGTSGGADEGGRAPAARPSTPNAAPGMSTPHFPRVTDPGREYRQARLEGSLALQDGCLRVVVGGESYLVVWPAHAVLDSTVAPGAVRVVDRRNGNAVQAGDRVELMGGVIDRGQIGSGDLDAPLPEACSGPLWLAGSFRRL